MEAVVVGVILAFSAAATASVIMALLYWLPTVRRKELMGLLATCALTVTGASVVRAVVPQRSLIVLDAVILAAAVAFICGVARVVSHGPGWLASMWSGLSGRVLGYSITAMVALTLAVSPYSLISRGTDSYLLWQAHGLTTIGLVLVLVMALITMQAVLVAFQNLRLFRKGSNEHKTAVSWAVGVGLMALGTLTRVAERAIETALGVGSGEVAGVGPQIYLVSTPIVLAAIVYGDVRVRGLRAEWQAKQVLRYVGGALLLLMVASTAIASSPGLPTTARLWLTLGACAVFAGPAFWASAWVASKVFANVVDEPFYWQRRSIEVTEGLHLTHHADPDPEATSRLLQRLT